MAANGMTAAMYGKLMIMRTIPMMTEMRPISVEISY